MEIEINIFLGVFLAATAGTTIAETLLTPLIKHLWGEFFDNRKRKNINKIELADSIKGLIVEGKNKKWRNRYREPEHFTYVIEEAPLLTPNLQKLLQILREEWDLQNDDRIAIENSGKPNPEIERRMEKRKVKLDKVHSEIKDIVDQYR
jgi:hypothetical protein